ncbi:hypothetical protein ACFWXO_40275 [Kitasatospora sp. NPDC059088]|uniref:hypothetical protein n=1 Tax=Kitasatospora sp. NPDC059088 TaxID=3346722 RepID=UPI0036CDA696
MSIKPVPRYTAGCDVCDSVYGLAPVFECAAYFDTREAAAEAVHADPDWLVTTDGRVICLDTDDPAHQAALDALMPPAPAAVCDGQIALDF